MSKNKPTPARLFEDKKLNSDPVTCLGQEFENDESRREFFTEELRQKLQDPEFRAIEGFPIGEDEDILALSDPPYYTACPNSWTRDFVEQWEQEKIKQETDDAYHREPFAADVSEGKTDQFYRAHTYHTKVPHKAIMRYILHYTEPGDIIFDGFCGTGMTGIAAQMCGNRQIVESLGYQVRDDGQLLKLETTEKDKKEWVRFSRLGIRKTVLNDLAPSATFIAAKYNILCDADIFEKTANTILKDLYDAIGWMYETLHSDGKTRGEINYTVWSEVFSCAECGGEIIFLEDAFDKVTYKVLDKFPCPHCSTSCSKGDLQLLFNSKFDHSIDDVIQTPKRIPVLINYSIGKNKYEKKPDDHDLAILEKINHLPYPTTVPTDALPPMHMANVGRMKTTNTSNIHIFFLPRQAHAIGTLWEKIQTLSDIHLKQILLWTVEQSIPGMSILNRYQPIMHGRPGGSQVNRQMSGVFYVPSQISECSPWYNLKGKIKRVTKAFRSASFKAESTCVSTGDCASSSIMDNSIDYIFTDPPFGENIYYSDLNYLVESWHRVKTSPVSEAIVDRVKKKTLSDYQALIESCFREYYRVLKPGKWATIEFSNTKAAVWNGIQTAIGNAGFIIASVSALDKKQGTFQAVNTPTAVKQDLVISAYKPNGGFEERFFSEASSEKGVWDFTRTHLKYLPITKQQAGRLVAIPERDPRILFDQMVAYYVRKGYPVPLSSQEFQVGLSQRFTERDSMIFLPEQVAEYDRKKMTVKELVQLSLFVSDEASAIQWLRQLLKSKPQTFSDINPLFMQEIGGWKKQEKALELSTLLKQNFLSYNGKEKVPEQIHAYLSTNWKDMRNLPKDAPILRAKAEDRWYVPDPTKAGDLEKLRERDLLKEFESYKTVKKFKRNDRFRLEAVRTGFKTAWQARDYQTIITIAEKIPPKILEEDPKLLMWYDQAVTRMGDQ